MLREALRHHQSGELDRAAPLYERILTVEPRHAEALHYLGLLAFQRGRLEEAERKIRESLRVREEAFFRSNLGLVLQTKGDTAGAIEAFERALVLDPKLAETSSNLGTALAGVNRFEEAMLCYQRALAIKPDFFEAHNGAGNVLQAQGRFAEAAASYARAVSLAPRNADLWGNLASAFQGEGKVEEAIASYRMAVELRPDFAGANYNLGTALLKRGELGEAAERLEKAIRTNPEYVLAHNNLGNVYKEQGRFEEAMTCYERTISLEPGNVRAHYNIGCLLSDLGDRDGALKRYEMALAIQPDDAQVLFSVGLLQVMRGEFEAGWRNYEWRWDSQDHDTPERHYPQPRWMGEKLDNGRLLLWAEQGVGDEIMFAGLVADAVRTGSDCILDCDPRLQPMFARSFPEVEVVSGFDAVRSVEAGVAAQIPVASLPGLFRRSEAAFGRTVSPYLLADPERRARFRERYADGGTCVVGVAWFTRGKKSGRVRSVGLGALTTLFGIPNLRWVSLQYGDGDALQAEVDSLGLAVTVDREVDQMTDMDGFAAQVGAMDLVITIDSSAAHLAGALGIPCWVLLPFAADWRWSDGRTDSPWYPRTRLFRQKGLGEWRAVVEEVREALTGIHIDGRVGAAGGR